MNTDTPNENTEGSSPTPLYRLDVDHVSPLSEASYNPLTGELHLLFDYDRLLDTEGEWWAGRHIDAVVINGQPFPLIIHDDAGPRDENGDYIFDRATVNNEFTVQIGAERVANDGTLEFSFTDKEDGGGDTYYTFSLVLDNPDEGEQPVEGVEQPEGLVLAVNAGGDAFTATNGVTYQADTFGNGNAFSTGAEISGTENDALYQSENWDMDGFHYEIEVDNGVYDLELNFAEIWGGAAAEGARVFEIAVEDSLVTLPVDIYSEAGMNAAFDLTGEVEVTDGALTISALNLVQNSKISGFSLWDASGDLSEAFEAGSFSGVSEAPENAVLTFTEGDDTVSISEDAEEVFLLGGDDRVRLSADVGLVDLGEGNNVLNNLGGYAGQIVSGAGNDRVTTRTDLGTIDTGAGDDVLLLTGDVEEVDAGDGNNTVSLIGNGTVVAGAGDDEVSLRGDGFVNAGLGNDVIDFAGSGLVYSGLNGGGQDNDTVNFSGTGTVLTFAGDDTVDFAGYGRVDTGFGNDTVTVNEASEDVIDTDGVGVTIDTLFGDDLVIVNAEAESIRVFEGENAVQLFAHAEAVSAGSGTDIVTVYGTGSAGTVDLGGGNNVLTSFGDIGSVTSGDGFDRIETRAGAEIGSIESGGGNDILFLQGDVAMLDTGAGNDVINHSGTGTVMGGANDDTLSNGVGGVDFFGGTGDDTFRFDIEDTNKDVFDGGEGTDTLLLTSFELANARFAREDVLESFGQTASSDGPVALDYAGQDSLFSELLNIEITGVETLVFG